LRFQRQLLSFSLGNSSTARLKMAPANIITIALVLGIISSGILFSCLFRRQALTIGLLTIGVALLTYGHVQWSVRRESPQIKEAMFIRHVVAGWALTGMGFVGLYCRGGRSKDDES
jgi:4-hydroxybenzoate polyprenyltransferase